MAQQTTIALKIFNSLIPFKSLQAPYNYCYLSQATHDQYSFHYCPVHVVEQKPFPKVVIRMRKPCFFYHYPNINVIYKSSISKNIYIFLRYMFILVTGVGI